MKSRVRCHSALWALVVQLILAACQTTGAPDPVASGEFRGQTWDYVVLGSSIGTFWKEYYGKLVESDLSVKVVYHDYYVGGQLLEWLLKNVRDFQRLRDDIRQAEIITIGLGLSDIDNALLKYGPRGPNDREKLSQELSRFRDTYDAIVREVVSLAQPAAIIRLMDVYFPYVQYDKGKSAFPDTIRDWSAFNSSIVEVGRRYGVPTARVCQAFNGRSGREDPADRGYLADDGKHPSPRGMAAIAEEFRKLGYRPSKR